MKAFIISPVKNLDPQTYAKILGFAEKLENRGYSVHIPCRDTHQMESAISICSQNKEAIASSDNVYIWFDKDSIGSVFDLGVVFTLGKPLKSINHISRTDEKSFANLVLDYIDSQDILSF